MSRKKNKKESWHRDLKPETKHSILAIFSFAIALVLALAYFGKAGSVGGLLGRALEQAFGNGFFLVPLIFFLAGLSFLLSSGVRIVVSTVVGGTLFLISSLGFVSTLFGEVAGGYIGLFVSYPLVRFFDYWPSVVVFSALILASLLIMLNTSLRFTFLSKKKTAPEIVVKEPLSATDSESQEALSKPESEIETEGTESAASSVIPQVKVQSDEDPADTKEPAARVPHRQRPVFSHYNPPPVDLLENDRGKPSSGDIKANANIIKRTLGNFGLDVEMAEVNVGPSVTQYTLRPAEGIKLARIIALQNDLALALSAHPLRIEAPIPGKPLVGIEIPNRSIALVGLRSLLSTPEFQKSAPLVFILGRDVTGQAVFADIAKMPHLLIAGATGSGKSIALHIIITSLLYKNSPELLRFIMIDPKRVELAVYNKIPHLLTPVVVDAKRTIHVLRWAVKDMERRYEKLAEVGAKDINGYNDEIRSTSGSQGEILPNLIIVIDELADLIAAYPREIEGSVVRLTQMSRAVGIHLLVATQRPSVEVITGLIKANITARIALQVASSVDSRTILDVSGADKLLGNGDMLYLAGDII